MGRASGAAGAARSGAQRPAALETLERRALCSGVGQINLTPAAWSTFSLVARNGYVFFRGEDAAHGGELWRTDCTVRGTLLVRDVHPGRGGSVSNVTVARGKLLLGANTDFDYGLWTSDGTAKGTIRVRAGFAIARAHFGQERIT